MLCTPFQKWHFEAYGMARRVHKFQLSKTIANVLWFLWLYIFSIFSMSYYITYTLLACYSNMDY